MLNVVILAGRLTATPVLRYTNTQQAVCSFTLANESDYKRDGADRKVSFIDCVAWDKSAEFVSKYFDKGSAIVVKGRLQSRDWTDSNGNKRISDEVVAEQCYFAESRRQETHDPVNPIAEPQMEELDEDDGTLPF